MAVDVRHFYFTLLCCAASATVAAQTLPDPTRPPVVGSASEATVTEQGVSNGLQTIIRRKGMRPAAVINGELVKLGAKSGDSTLVKVGDDYVVLKSPTGTQIIRLTPSIQKTATRRAKATPATRKKAEE